MKIDWFSTDEMCGALPAVTSAQIYSKRGFNPNGLFSERIFGPVKNCTCSCGTYWGRSKIGMVCPECGVTIENCSVRRKNEAKIELPFPVINPVMFYLIDRVGKATMTNIVMSMIYDDTVFGFYYNATTERYVKIKKPTLEGEAMAIPEGSTVYTGPMGIYNIIAAEAEKNKETSKNWKYIFDNLSKFWMSNIGVVPPEFRPVSKSKDVQMRDKMNEYYITILNFADINAQNLLDDADSDVYRINFKNLQKYVFDLYEYIFSKFSKKSGLIRGSILGKRIDFSGRAVICPDPDLELDQCSIPYLMALEFYKLQVVNRLLEIKNFLPDRKFIRYDPTLKFVDDCIETNNIILLDIVREVSTDKLIVLNRQPTLHRMGLMSFRCLVNTDYVIKIHPFACEPFNADFDGDQMAAYISLYEETEESNRQHMYIMSNLISPSTGDLCLSVNQDVVLGLYLLTKPGTETVDHVVGNKTIKTYPGRIEFNKVFPAGFPFINETITKKRIQVILNVVAKNCTPDVIKNTLDNVKRLGFAMTTKIGSTFSLKNLTVDDRVYDAISEVVDNPNIDLKEKFFALQDHPLKAEVQRTFPYADFIESGSRGSWDQANQLIFCRGYVSNSKGEVVTTPIKNNLIKGLTKKEFFVSCYGARKALLDVALNTAVSGYLTRKLVYCNVNVEFNESMDDCGTTDYFEVKVPEIITPAIIEQRTADIQDPAEKKVQQDILKHQNDNMDPIKLMRSLRYRWYMDDDGVLKQITEDNYLTLCGRTLKVRSPLFCKSSKICRKCYGESIKYLHSKYIGVVAAQALGEVATQLTLRTFHVGGIAQMSQTQDDDSQQDIINDLNVVKRLLHSNDKDSRNYADMIMQLFSIYSRHKVLLLVNFELVISQIMRAGNIRWRLHPTRDEIQPNIVSIEKVPSLESFLLALAFSKPYNYIVSGILGTSQNTDGILEKMLTNKA